MAAHAELGSRYDGAVAEGLVERIGDEIDKRIDARLGGQASAEPASAGRQPRVPTTAYQGPPAYQGPAPLTPSMPPAAPPPPAVPWRVGGLSGMVLGLGSMGLGVGATAVVVSHHVESVAAAPRWSCSSGPRSRSSTSPTPSDGSEPQEHAMFERFTEQVKARGGAGPGRGQDARPQSHRQRAPAARAARTSRAVRRRMSWHPRGSRWKRRGPRSRSLPGQVNKCPLGTSRSPSGRRRSLNCRCARRSNRR